MGFGHGGHGLVGAVGALVLERVHGGIGLRALNFLDGSDDVGVSAAAPISCYSCCRNEWFGSKFAIINRPINAFSQTVLP